MSDKIHSSAVIEDGCVLGSDVVIGPFCHVGPEVILGDGVELLSHVSVQGITKIGSNTRIFPFASVGNEPQDLKFAGERVTLEVGDNCTIREGVTLNPGTAGGGNTTTIGNNCAFLANSHVAHDCRIGNGVICSNNVMIAGHCDIGDHVIFGGGSAIHQFSRVGHNAFIGGLAGVEGDLIPFGMAMGNRANLAGLNLIGMKRAGISRESIHLVRAAFKELFSGDKTVQDTAKALRESATDPQLIDLLDFIMASADRALCTCQCLEGLPTSASGVTGLDSMQTQANLTDPLAIIAGNGRLPLQIAERLAAQSRPVFIIGIRGEADSAIETHPHEWCGWEQVGHIFKTLKQRGISDVVLAGGVIGRPELKLHKMDWGAIRTLPGLLAALLGGDNQILTGVIAAIEKRGFTVCNVAELLPEMTVQPGANTSTKAKSKQLKQIAEGHAVTKSMGQHDIGQACVVVGSRAIALEGVEGTDAMLARVGEMRRIGRLPQRPGGVLIKAVKPGQDERADLPTIGPDTIRSVHEAGLLGIGVEAGKTLIIEKEATIQLANQHGLFIHGFDSQQLDKS